MKFKLPAKLMFVFVLALAAVAVGDDPVVDDPASGVVPVPEKVQAKKVPGAKPRNVVFILSDDHRYDAMSFLGHQFAETPHLDSLAKNGVHMKNAFVTTSLCSPSRASILTGLYTFRHRVIDNQRLVPKGTLFFPQYLQDAGYKTGFVGKWHMGGHTDDPRPGFDYWVSFRGQGHYTAPTPDYTINENGKRVPQNGYITTLLTRYALDFLDHKKTAKNHSFCTCLTKPFTQNSHRKKNTPISLLINRLSDPPAKQRLGVINSIGLVGCLTNATAGTALISLTKVTWTSSSITSDTAKHFARSMTVSVPF